MILEAAATAENDTGIPGLIAGKGVADRLASW
jgi:hypothetical protein